MPEIALRQHLIARPRRLRRNESLRALVRETRVHASNLVAPLFVQAGRGIRIPIPSLPGQARVSPDEAVRDAERLLGRGVQAVLLFGIPGEKDATGTGAYADDGIVQEAVRASAGADPALLIVTDVCLCEYTDHGHCGVLRERRGRQRRDARAARARPRSPTPRPAPTLSRRRDMMDGRVGAIREALDDAGFTQTPIMSLRGQVRVGVLRPVPRGRRIDAAVRRPPRATRWTRRTLREALREISLDVAEGADIVMVKPALAYLDVIRAVRDAYRSRSPRTGQRRVRDAQGGRRSGLARRASASSLEILTAIRRAGADIIITYAAADAAGWLNDGSVLA